MSLRDPHGNELRIITTKKETSFETTEAWNMKIVLLFVFCSCSIQQKRIKQKSSTQKSICQTNEEEKSLEKQRNQRSLNNE